MGLCGRYKTGYKRWAVRTKKISEINAKRRQGQNTFICPRLSVRSFEEDP
jgi:hypothetical protein